MRKPRAVIFDDDAFILSMLKDFFLMRGYEVLSYSDPTAFCRISEDNGKCSYQHPCCDILITDFSMPRMNGVDFLMFQMRKGCRLDTKNKAVISGYIDENNMLRVRTIGCKFFHKPFTLIELSDWLSICEQHMDLVLPLATRRKEERFESYREISFMLTRTQETLTGIAVNVSPSGLCLKAPAALQPQDRINIHAGHFYTCRQASVQWVRHDGNGFCFAGLRCC